jgi:hypothetical protein
MSDQRAATALRIALLRERAESAACRVAQGALDAARGRLTSHGRPVGGYDHAADGGALIAAYSAAAGRAATALAAERDVADAHVAVTDARTAWAKSAQRRQALEEAARRVEAIRRIERERADQRAADDIAGGNSRGDGPGRRRGRR